MDKENNKVLLEKVSWIEDECLIRILQGVAEYQKKIYYFDCIYSELENTWSNEYFLTLLNKEIFELKLWNFEYLCEWHKQSSEAPHWEDYKIEREENTFEEIKNRYRVTGLLKKAEQNYLNQKIIDKYLFANKPKFRFNGTFYVNDIEYNINEILYKEINQYTIKVKWGK